MCSSHSSVVECGNRERDYDKNKMSIHAADYQMGRVRFKTIGLAIQRQADCVCVCIGK